MHLKLPPYLPQDNKFNQEISLGICAANERCFYIVTKYLIGWVHT